MWNVDHCKRNKTVSIMNAFEDFSTLLQSRSALRIENKSRDSLKWPEQVTCVKNNLNFNVQNRTEPDIYHCIFSSRAWLAPFFYAKIIFATVLKCCFIMDTANYLKIGKGTEHAGLVFINIWSIYLTAASFSWQPQEMAAPIIAVTRCFRPIGRE